MFSPIFQPGGSPQGWGYQLDWVKLQQIAYGPLNLTPAVFWSLTHAEFMLLCEGYQERRRVQQQRDAWVLANLLQPYSKQRLSIHTFLKQPRSSSGGQSWSVVSEEEFQELVRRHPQLATQQSRLHGFRR